MDYLQHEYLVPVIIGNSQAAHKAAKSIYRITGVRSHIFSDSFTLWQRLFYYCHKVSSKSQDMLEMSLISFADSLDEYLFPVIIFCDGESQDFIKNYTSTIESAYVAISYNDLIKKERRTKP